MKLYGYGEDALTLWAIHNKLHFILASLADPSEPLNCQTFFRPSFGRRGGENRSEFGEFDFVILSEHTLYLGESKWSQSSEKVENRQLILRQEQKLRHKLFQFYVEQWAFGHYQSWNEFCLGAVPHLQQLGIKKPLAPQGSLLAQNLQTILSVIKQHFTSMPQMQNLLLYFHKDMENRQLPTSAGQDFRLVHLNYSPISQDHFVVLTGLN